MATKLGENTFIVECTCSHPFQDERYGKGKRVAVRCKAQATGVIHARCTVCGRIHEIRAASPKQSPKTAIPEQSPQSPAAQGQPQKRPPQPTAPKQPPRPQVAPRRQPQRQSGKKGR